ncbi:MAG: PilZ domain-containing protein [Desulfobacca sp.]|nr:PilZ domain-containing protein [Desulfobacca sp.]
MDLEEKRRDQRIPLDAVLLPFLGSREEDQACFEYLPLDISLYGVGIVIPQWLVNRERLRKGDLINLNVPFELQGKTFHQGKIVWTRWDDSLQGQVSGLSLEKEMPSDYPLYFAVETSRVIPTSPDVSIEGLLVRVLKDAMLLKKGIAIYFNHLIPYFSRITGYPAKDYTILKEVFLHDIKQRLTANRDKLQELYESFSRSQDSYKDMARHLNLEDLREIIESEIYIEVMKVTFESDAALQYLLAIKQLEKKLYYNYNTIVMIYIESLS